MSYDSHTLEWNERDKKEIQRQYDDMLEPAPGLVEQWECDCGWHGTDVLLFDQSWNAPIKIGNLCPECKQRARKVL